MHWFSFFFLQSKEIYKESKVKTLEQWGIFCCEGKTCNVADVVPISICIYELNILQKRTVSSEKQVSILWWFLAS